MKVPCKNGTSVSVKDQSIVLKIESYIYFKLFHKRYMYYAVVKLSLKFSSNVSE